MPNFSSNKHFRLFGSNLPKKGISDLEQHQFQHNEIRLATKIDLRQEILFFFFNQICPQRVEKCPGAKFCVKWFTKCWCFHSNFPS